MIAEELTDYGKLAYDKTQDMEREQLNMNNNLFPTIETLCFTNANSSFKFYSEIGEIIHIKLELSYVNNTGELNVKLNNQLVSKHAMQNEINLYFRANLNNCIEISTSNETVLKMLITCVGKIQLYEKNNYIFIEECSTNKVIAYDEKDNCLLTYNSVNDCADKSLFSGIKQVESGFINFTNDFINDFNWRVLKALKINHINNLIKINTISNENILTLENEENQTIIIGIPNSKYRFMQFRLNNNSLEFRYILHDNSKTEYVKISIRLNLKIKKIIPIHKLDALGSIAEILIQTTTNEIYYLFGTTSPSGIEYKFNDFLIKIHNGRNVNCYGKDNKLYFFIEQSGEVIKLIYLLNKQKLYKINKVIIQNYIGGFESREYSFLFNHIVITKFFESDSGLEE